MCNTIEILILDYQNIPELLPQKVDSKGKLDGLNDHKYASCSTRSSITLFVIRLSFMSRRVSLIISLFFSLFFPKRYLVLPNMSCMITFDVVPLERRAFKKGYCKGVSFSIDKKLGEGLKNWNFLLRTLPRWYGVGEWRVKATGTFSKDVFSQGAVN